MAPTGDTAGDFDAHRNPLWRGPDGAPLVEKVAEAITVSFGPAQAASHGQAFTGAADGKPFPLAPNLGLASRGIYTANVSVRLADLSPGPTCLRLNGVRTWSWW